VNRLIICFDRKWSERDNNCQVFFFKESVRSGLLCDVKTNILYEFLISEAFSVCFWEELVYWNLIGGGTGRVERV
jgi:hypothetical protein